jgi:hypothetical protein
VKEAVKRELNAYGKWEIAGDCYGRQIRFNLKYLFFSTGAFAHSEQVYSKLSTTSPLGSSGVAGQGQRSPNKLSAWV